MNHNNNMKLKMKKLSHLLLLILCLGCLTAFSEASVNDEKIQELLLRQIDEERMTYNLYTELMKVHPDVNIFKGMIADKKGHFLALVNYAEEKYPDMKTGNLKSDSKFRETGKLYEEGLKKGIKSPESAVEVGIKIEKLDIQEGTDFINLDSEPELST